ncbi:zona pellucida sperm-binding protein 4-like [Aplochiton taeniatus]
MCYYGKMVTVQCTRDAQFVVVVAIDATLPHLDLESISFLGEGSRCSPVGRNSEFAIYQFSVTECGTVMREEPGVIIYENRMISSYEVAVGPYGAITRDSHYEVMFQARYVGTAIEALVVEILQLKPPFPVAQLGPLRVELRLANGHCLSKGCSEGQEAYTSYYADADYPVTKVLREPVYAEIRILERTDPNIVLTLDRCWATGNNNPFSMPQWDLLINGCPYRDDRYLTSLVAVGPNSGVTYPTHYRRFIFKMFTFVDPSTAVPLRDKIFIHCNTAVCQNTALNSCEPICFRKSKS